MGYFLSLVASYQKAMVAAVVCCIGWAVTSGLSPTLIQIKQYLLQHIPLLILIFYHD